ncbi:MAG: alpha-ketoglutarate-dependent dioxygenase AlkB [Proteobacteria bacterium]|nr:alpha-ketoglutarate-dependent dioxygenase AlkB [Pseudomonadota bacterium]
MGSRGRADASRQVGGSAACHVLADGGELQLWQHWIGPDVAEVYFERLRDELPWRQETITIAGRQILQPRLSAWIGDAEAVYVYSGLTNRPGPWTATLRELRMRLQCSLGTPFNSVLANYYRSERDSMGWHADNEPELGGDPTIASLSFGAARRFILKHKKRKHARVALSLGSGSLLVMRGTTQRYWKHSVPKENAPRGQRINLTFRLVRGRVAGAG